MLCGSSRFGVVVLYHFYVYTLSAF
jgi:hypothetical protein